MAGSADLPKRVRDKTAVTRLSLPHWQATRLYEGQSPALQTISNCKFQSIERHFAGIHRCLPISHLVHNFYDKTFISNEYSPSSAVFHLAWISRLGLQLKLRLAWNIQEFFHPEFLWLQQLKFSSRRPHISNSIDRSSVKGIFLPICKFVRQFHPLIVVPRPQG